MCVSIYIYKYIYIYNFRLNTVYPSGTESPNSRLSHKNCNLVYFSNCVQMCGCWYSGVSDTVRCACACVTAGTAAAAVSGKRLYFIL